MKDLKQTNDIFIGDYVSVPCRITSINETTGVVGLVTVNPRGTETVIATLLNTQINKD